MAPFAPPPRRGLPPSLRYPVKLCSATTVTVYLMSLLTGNVSQVDRLWTFLPVIYSAYYAFLPFWPNQPLLPLFPYVPPDISSRLIAEANPRAILMFALQFIWMIRLSYNTWRRGLFNFHEEDYRWEILRNKIPPWLFQIFNLVFIAIIQNVLLFMLSIPTHYAAVLPPSARQLQTTDYVLAVLSLVDLALEFTADNQQYAYQTYKRSGVFANEWPGARIKFTQEDVERGFITKGLWAWSRHPNFACEQTFWILQALFPIFASGRLPDFVEHGDLKPLAPLIPAMALCLLFFSSTIFTESISLSKYPQAYKAYQRRVAMFIPVLTPVWGWLLKLQGNGQREYCDRLVYGTETTKKIE